MKYVETKDKLELAFIDSVINTRANKSLYVVFFDINSLKQVNDMFGHLMGDLVVKTCIQKILNNVRESDRLICFGGDEFVLFMPNWSEVRVKTLMETIQEEIKSDKVLIEKVGGSSIAMGVVKYSKELHKDLNGVLAAADDLMYLAKSKPPKFLVCNRNYVHDNCRRTLNSFSPEINRKRSYFSWLSSYIIKEHPNYNPITVINIMRNLWRLHDMAILQIPPQILLETINKLYNEE